MVARVYNLKSANYSLKSELSDLPPVDCQVIGVFPSDPPALFETFKKTIPGSDLKEKWTDSILEYPSESRGVSVPRILWVPLGKKEKYNLGSFRKAFAQALGQLEGIRQHIKTLDVDLTSFAHGDWTEEKLLTPAIELLEAVCYKFDQFKTTIGEKEADLPPLKHILSRVNMHLSSAERCRALESTVQEAQVMAECMGDMKDWSNLPPNVCTPSYLANEALALATWGVKVSVLDTEDMAKLGMGAFLGVAQGSEERPKFVVMEYRPSASKNADKPIVLVGKGVTFDSGGVSIKPSSAMVGMKYDMCGAAAVLATIKGVARLSWPVSVVGIMALSENMVSGRAQRVGDIVKTMSGLTVEITNTDAEGRLLLCDALTYTERFNPSAVIDMATLTGACIVALGVHATGLLGNNEALIREVQRAGAESHDRVWELPLWDEFAKPLESTAADILNCTVGESGAAGTITAAAFLSRFTEKYPWVHLDIAGTATKGGFGKDSVATGRPIPLLFRFLKNRLLGI